LATLVGLLTLFSMIKIWSEVFWKPAPQDTGGHVTTGAPVSAWMLAPVLVLAGTIIGLGLFMDPVLRFAEIAAGQLLEPGGYVKAVLEGAP
jgi:multicomponent Na+:H+ antiporter subunit D